MPYVNRTLGRQESRSEEVSGMWAYGQVGHHWWTVPMAGELGHMGGGTYRQCSSNGPKYGPQYGIYTIATLYIV